MIINSADAPVPPPPVPPFIVIILSADVTVKYVPALTPLLTSSALIAGILIFALKIAPEEIPEAKASVYVFASKFNLEFIFLLSIAFSNDSV